MAPYFPFLDRFLGSFAVVSLMTGMAKRRILPDGGGGGGGSEQRSNSTDVLGNSTNDAFSSSDGELTAIAVVSTITLGVGLVQVISVFFNYDSV